MPKSRRQMIASLREKTLFKASVKLVSRKRTMRAVEMRRRSGSSFDTVSFLTLMGWMTAATPISRRTLIMLLPITLPRRMSVLPLMREEKETASSGAPVPKATIVRPTRSLLTLKLDATDEAPSTKRSAPLIRKMKPIISIKICKNISIMLIIIARWSFLDKKMWCERRDSNSRPLPWQGSALNN